MVRRTYFKRPSSFIGLTLYLATSFKADFRRIGYILNCYLSNVFNSSIIRLIILSKATFNEIANI